MKKIFLSVVICMTGFIQGYSKEGNTSSSSEYLYDYIFFENSLMKDFHFYTRTSYEAPSWIKNSRQHLPISTEVSFSPGNALELTYLSSPGSDWYAEVQYCPVRGNDFFRTPQQLSIQLYSLTPLSETSLPEIAIRYKDSTYTRQLKLVDYMGSGEEKTWHTLTIPLVDFGLGRVDDTNIKQLAAIAFYPGVKDGKEYTLFLDDIELLPEGLPVVTTLKTPELKPAKAYEQHIDLVWTPQSDENVKYYRIYRSTDGTNYTLIAIRRPWLNRYADFVGETGYKAWYKVAAVDYALNESASSQAVSATTYPMTDEQLLDMVQEANFRYYWEGAESVSGLARENIPGRKNMIATGASGFGIMATLVAIERGFISREEGIERFITITSFLEKADKFHGAVSHFIDGPTGKVEPFFGKRDNGGDLVETSFLFQGLLAARQYFDQSDPREKKICNSIDKLWKEVEWSWYKRYKDSPFLYWHWSPDQEWVIDHRLIGWNETMITYLLAIMAPKHRIAPEMYYTGWASPDPYAQEYRIDWGKTSDGSMYTNGKTYFGKKLEVSVSNGGPLFFIHYSYLGLNPHKFTDKYVNYFENNRKIALINYRYCVENQGKYIGYGDACWGLTASDFAWRYQAQEPMPHRDNGTIAPTGALASFPYTPEESMKALKNYYRNFGAFLWGEYGFRDACNLTVNWCSPLFMGLNQAPVTVMIENYRTGLVWDLFMSHPDVQQGIKKIEAIKTF